MFSINNENVNWKIIKEWYGWEYTYNKDYKYKDQFLENMEYAKNNKMWLWSSNNCNWERKAVEIIEEESYLDLYDETSDSFSCSTSKTCSSISSCSEAYFYLNSCGKSSLDRDKDWIPCESICN